jgi:FK506-binding nuclear protein
MDVDSPKVKGKGKVQVDDEEESDEDDEDDEDDEEFEPEEFVLCTLDPENVSYYSCHTTKREPY